jgi:acetyl-CoA acetyltransferase family protein
MQSSGYDTRRPARAEAALRPAQRQGTVTAGNSSQLSDGASATLVMSRQRADELKIPYKLVFRGFQVAGCDPDEMGIGPVFAVPKLLQRAGVKSSEIDLWELNEAFAVQVIYCRDRLGIDPEKMNVNGGSISIGHPFGMTGSRMVGTLANEMARRGAKIATESSPCASAAAKARQGFSSVRTERVPGGWREKLQRPALSHGTISACGLSEGWHRSCAIHLQPRTPWSSHRRDRLARPCAVRCIYPR